MNRAIDNFLYAVALAGYLAVAGYAMIFRALYNEQIAGGVDSGGLVGPAARWRTRHDPAFLLTESEGKH